MTTLEITNKHFLSDFKVTEIRFNHHQNGDWDAHLIINDKFIISCDDQEIWISENHFYTPKNAKKQVLANQFFDQDDLKTILRLNKIEQTFDFLNTHADGIFDASGRLV